ILLWLLLLSSIAACSPGHLGSNEIAFLRNGQLWTIDPDGANAFMVVANAPEVVSYGWSPNHQLLTFRTLDPNFAKTAARKHIARKLLPGTFSIPYIDASSSMVIENSQNGMFTTSIAGTDIHYLVQGLLAGHPLMASLERILWQPAHEQPDILYALPSTTQPD